MIRPITLLAACLALALPLHAAEPALATFHDATSGLRLEYPASWEVPTAAEVKTRAADVARRMGEEPAAGTSRMRPLITARVAPYSGPEKQRGVVLCVAVPLPEEMRDPANAALALDYALDNTWRKFEPGARITPVAREDVSGLEAYRTRIDDTRGGTMHMLALVKGAEIVNCSAGYNAEQREAVEAVWRTISFEPAAPTAP